MKEVDRSAAAVAELCARILDESKMERIEVLDVVNSLQIADYFVLASGRNARHLKAATDDLFKKLREAGIRRSGVEGYDAGRWILVDLGDVVAHLFEESARAFYDLDSLWGDCPRLSWQTRGSA